MTEITAEEEIAALKKELSKLRLETNLRKSLAMQLEKQKQIADEAKADAQSKSQQLEAVSEQLAKYLSPQIYDQIFSGKQSVEVNSSRKKLTVFFSDIVNFTHISDELESEELTALVNFYLNEMSQIALRYGATIDKFIGDAVMIFFGDPESLGYEEDAKKCVTMAIAMQKRMRELQGYWGPHFALKEDLKIRIGINTGFCTVGNFGSNDRVDYTAIGSSVNLASRLEHAALPGTILVSEETFLLMKEHFSFAKEKKIDVKGLGRKISCHEVDIEDDTHTKIKAFSEDGFDLKINSALMTPDQLERLAKIISNLKNPAEETQSVETIEED